MLVLCMDTILGRVIALSIYRASDPPATFLRRNNIRILSTNGTPLAILSDFNSSLLMLLLKRVNNLGIILDESYSCEGFAM